MYIIDYLLKSYGVKEEVTNILDNIELVAVPFVNPDGYVVSGSNFKIHLTATHPSPFPAHATPPTLQFQRLAWHASISLSGPLYIMLLAAVY